MTTNDAIMLPALDGSNPLGYFAALGLLRILSDHSMSGKPAPRLSWVNIGRWAAVVHWPGSKDDLLDLIERDLQPLRAVLRTKQVEPNARTEIERNLQSSSADLALDFAYDDDGTSVKLGEPVVCDLKPLPATLRAFHERTATTLAADSSRRVAMRRSADIVAAYGSDAATDNNGRAKPTAFHFTAGQQTFLSMVRELALGVSRAHFDEALWGPWQSASKLPSLSWNSAAPRIYALRAGNPAKEKRGSVPGADWLAFLALTYFQCASKGRRIRTACVHGGWKDGRFVWPLWAAPITEPVIRSLLARGDAEHWSTEERNSAGIAAVMRSQILRSDQGGYGSFTPSAVI